ncbi:MAG: sugar transferase [Coriobacteriales bacterium]
MGKRVFDIAFSLVVIAILLIPALVLSVAIAIDTKSTPLYFQKRVGLEGQVFHLVKFRTMVKSADAVEQHLTPEQLAEWSSERKVTDDPRVTRLGRVLRHTSLDELPQFLNVLVGQMSVVGPRPITEHELHWFGSDVRKFLSVPMGITGLWQVTTRNDAPFSDGSRQRIELRYVDERCFALDARILLHTLGVMFTKKNG